MPINTFQRQMQSALRHANMGQLENAVLVLGETGDGKSTFIGYAQGCELQYVALPEQRLVVSHCPEGIVPPKIGTQVHSETLFPAVFRGLNAFLNWVDFPGFQGNLDEETTLLEFLATQVAVKTIHSVKSVVFLMSYEKMLSDSRDAHILSSMALISSLFKDLNSPAMASLQLLISHLPQMEPPSKTDIIEMLSRTHAFIKDKLAIDNTLEHQRMEQLLSHFIQTGNDGAILLFNPLSNSTRHELLAHVSNLPAMSPSMFNLVGTQHMQQKFLHRMKSEIATGQEVLNFLLNSAAVHHAIQANISNFTRRVSELTNETQTLLDLVTDVDRPIEVHSPALDTLKALMTAKTLEIQALDRDNKFGENATAVLTHILYLESNSEIVLYETKKWREYDAFGGVPTKNPVYIVRTGAAYAFSNNSYKIICECRPHSQPGRIENLKETPSIGQYEVTYYPPSLLYGSIVVRFYMQYNKQPKIAEELATLNELVKLITVKKTLEEQIANLTTSLIKDKKEKDTFAHQSCINGIISANNNHNESQQTLKSHYAHHKQAVQHFHENKPSYQIIDTFNQAIGLNATVENTFHASYLGVLHLLNESPLSLSDLPWHDAPIPFLHNIPYYLGQFPSFPRRFATHKLPARLSNQTINTTLLFDSWGWDPLITMHPVTKKPLFTLRLFLEDKEIGSAVYYGQPLFCRSENGARHNIIATTGLLSKRSVNTSDTGELCTMPLPPTVWDKAISGALQGAVSGAVDVLGYSLEALHVPKKVSKMTQDLVYYSVMLWMRYSEHLSEEKSSTDALTEAVTETALMYCIHLSFKLIDCIAAICNQRQHTYLSQGLTFFSRSLKFAPLISNAAQQGLEKMGAFIGAGILAQELTRNVGRDIVDRLSNNAYSSITQH